MADSVLADSSILLAAILDAEPDHAAAVELLETYTGDIIVIDLSLLKLQYLLRRERVPTWQRTRALQGIHDTFVIASLTKGTATAGPSTSWTSTRTSASI